MSEYASINEQLDWKKAEVIAAGVDSGAVSSKAVILLDGQPYAFSQIRTRMPKESAFSAINGALAKTDLELKNIHYLVATGRGRTQVPFARETISEIACGAQGRYAFGAHQCARCWMLEVKVARSFTAPKKAEQPLFFGTTNVLRVLDATWKHLLIWFRKKSMRLETSPFNLSSFQS